MYDIHHHLLPGLDDGAVDMETSVEMASLAVADGITHVVCTPHANGRYDYDRERNAALVAELQDRLARARVPLTLGLGCDFHLSYDNVQDALVEPKRFTINQTSYLLIELPDYGIPPGVTDTFHDLQRAGLVLILTHPERNPTLVANPGRMVEWIHGGMLVQVTADSVSGRFGKIAQKMTNDLLDKRWVHFVATDAHNIESRPPRMREAWATVAKRCGEEYATALCERNPGAVFRGEPLGEQAEMLWPLKEFEKRSWWDQLRGR